MKNKIKKMSILASAICAVVATAGLMSACGEEKVVIDYESLDYQGWTEVAESVWDGKTISYQIEIPKIVNATSGTVYSYLFNLYDDGTMLMYQCGLYNTLAKDAAWYDEDRHITWAYFGLWEKAEDGSNLSLYYYVEPAYYGGSTSLNGDTVRKEASWVDAENYHFNIICEETSAGSGSYVLKQTDDNVINYLMLNNKGEMHPIGFTEAAVLSGSSIKYNTIQSYVDSYINDAMAEA